MKYLIITIVIISLIGVLSNVYAINSEDYNIYQINGITYAQNIVTNSTDYSGSDFATVLQNVINNTNTHHIKVEYGNYSLSKEIILKSNLDLEINGYWKISSGSYHDILHIHYNMTNIKIQGPATLDGNSKNQNPNITFSDIIAAGGSNNIIIKDLNLTNSYNWPLNIGGNNIHVENVIGSYSGNGIIFATPTAYDDDCEKCIVHDIKDDWGLMAYGGSHDITFDHSIAYNVAWTGIGVLSDGNQQLPSHDVTITNSISYNNGYSGFGISGYSQHAYNVILNSNIARYNNQANAWTGNGGYAITQADNVIIENNLSFKNGVGSNGASGYYAQNTNYTKISNNISVDEGQGSNLGGLGILINQQNKHLIISGNSIIDNQNTRTVNIGINFIAQPQDTSVFGNDFSPNIQGIYVPNASWITNNFDNVS